MFYVIGKILLQHNMKKLPSCKLMHFIVYTYLLYLYTTPVVWQTKHKFMMCIAHVLHMFTGGCVCTPKLRAIVCVNTKFLSFTCGKHTSMHVHVYLHKCKA